MWPFKKGKKETGATKINYEEKNPDETLVRSRNAIKKIEELITSVLGLYLQTQSISEKEKKAFYPAINSEITFINAYLKQLKIIAIALVNGRLKNTSRGNDLNLNFLSVLNKTDPIPILPSRTLENDLKKLEKEIMEINF